MLNLRKVGSFGERIAFDFLKKKGYHIIERNFNTKFGEIDIIAKDKEDIVFVEVKFRTSKEYGTPCDAVNDKKQKRIIKSAICYLKMKNYINKNIRFDVLSIGPETDKIEIIKSAFISEPIYTF